MEVKGGASLNIFKSRQNGLHYAGNICEIIFLNEILYFH